MSVKKLAKNTGIEVEEIKADVDTVKVGIYALGGLQEVEAPKGITIAELKRILNCNDTFADKKTSMQLNDEFVINEDTELYRVVVKDNAAM